MSHLRRTVQILTPALLVLALPALSQLPLKNHSIEVDVGSATVCRDGAIFVAEADAASSLNLAMTPQIYDQLGTTLAGTGTPYTFTFLGEMRTFTVPYPMGTFNVGDPVGISVTNVPGDPFASEAFFANTATVADCSIAVPAMPAPAAVLLVLLLLASGGWLAGKTRGVFADPGSRRLLGLALLIPLGLPAVAVAGLALPRFSKAFSPDIIGPGSTSMLIFTIDNSDSPGIPAGSLAFTDTLPAEITLAAPALVSNSCGGTLTAPDNGSTITLSDGMASAGGACTVVVNVTSSSVGEGPYTNVSGDLTSDRGNSGPAMADLRVADDRPGFRKSFAPSTVPFGGRSTLTFTIDNLLNGSPATSLSFSDSLPPGMVVASPANASTDCGTPTAPATLTATPGSSSVSLSQLGTAGSPGVPAGDSCTVTVDVVGGAVGPLGNVSGVLMTTVDNQSRDAGKAAAVLQVTGFESLLSLTKTFTDDPVAPGGTVTLEFRVTNRSRDEAATGITFDDDLETVLSGLAPTLPPTPEPPCGAGSMLSFAGGTLTLTGGTLAPETNCTFRVELTVPPSATPGTSPNTAGPVSGIVGGEGVTGNSASDLLFVVDFPVLSKEFTDDPVGAGGTVTLEFTIMNSSTSAISDIAFLDELTDDGAGGGLGLPFPVSVTLPPSPDPPCGGSSSLSLVSAGSDRQALSLTDGSLEASDGMPGGPDTCTFSVGVEIPAGLGAGTYLNTTETISATLDDVSGTPTVTGPAASDSLVVVGAPSLTKEFTDDPVAPGGTVTLELILSHDELAGADASAIAFTDDLALVLPGAPDLTATAVGANTCTGSTVDVSMPTLIDFSGGSLMPGESCSIRVSLAVPAASPSGLFDNTTSDVTATVGGVATTAPGPSDDLLVTGLRLIKEFTDDPVIAGGTVTLQFTLDNTSGTSGATSIHFTDNLDTVIPGLTAMLPSSPDPPCGTSSSLTGSAADTFLTFSGGEVAAGSSCTFSVTLTVPATIPNPSPPPSGMIATPDDVYPNATSNLLASIGGSTTTLPPATNGLTVDSEFLEISKEFTDDPVSPGGTVTLRFTVENLSATETVTDIAFSDDLDAALSGLTASGASFNNCGGMATSVFPTGLFTYAGGTLLPEASCDIVLDLTVPAGPLSGTTFPNTTSVVTGKVGGLDVFGSPASDDLRVDTVTFVKSFDGASTATGTPKLTFTITNLDSANGVTGLAFLDDLDAVLPGLVATGLPVSDACGTGSTLAGTSVLTLTGASLGPAGSCSFDVDLAVPGDAGAGTYLNTTSNLTTSGLVVAPPASAMLQIEPPPTFAKVFVPDSLGVGQVSILTFTIDNSGSALAASGLDFTDNLPAGVVVASPANASTTCTGGTLTATPSTGTITYSGGAVAAGASCTVSVDITPTGAGAFVNTTDNLTSSSGSSGTATDTLTANPQPGFSKAFAPAAIVTGARSRLTFTIDNTSSTVAATALAFADNLPAGMVVASPANSANTCTGGTVGAGIGSGMVSYSGGTVAAGASCTIAADVTATAVGVLANTSGPLTSSLGSSGTASASLTAEPAPTLTKSFSGAAAAGGTVDLTFTLQNQSASLTVTGIAFTDDLDGVVSVLAASLPPTPDPPCGTGSMLAGPSFLALSNGQLGPGGSCSFTVTLNVPADAVPGTYPNVTSDLTVGGDVVSPPASADLVIVPPPAFRKAFQPGSVGEGSDAVLRFEVDNTASSLAATGLDFTDLLPAGLEIASSPSVASTCGGTTTAIPGGTTISLSGGSVAAGGVCTFEVTIHAPDPGTFVNTTGDLTSSSGNSGTATDTLEVRMCMAADGNNATLGNEFILDLREVEVCNTITLQQHLTLLGPNGVLILRAGHAVVIENGVEFAPGSTVSISVDPALLP